MHYLFCRLTHDGNSLPMARTRNPYFEAVHRLEIGEEVALPTLPSETLVAAATRIKQHLAGWRKDGRSYRVRVDPDAVRVQRTRFDCNRQLADWQAMPAGSMLLLKSKPTAADQKKAQNSADHLNAKGSGVWMPFLDREGRLVVYCRRDLANQSASGTPKADTVVRRLWRGEWA